MPYPEISPGKKLIFRARRRAADGSIIYASKFGRRAFPLIFDEDASPGDGDD